MNHARYLLATVATPLLAASFVFAGCGSNDDGPSAPSSGAGSTSSSASSGGGGAAGGGGGAGGAVDPPPQTKTRTTASGDITWQVAFDPAAQAAGATDCSYTRHYEAVEDRSAPWLCPTCEVIFRADVAVTAGLQDCYSQVSAATPAAVEWIGRDSSGRFWRSSGAPMTDQGTATATASGLDIVNTVPDLPAQTGTMSFAVAGALRLGQADGDPLDGWVTPHHSACGWPRADAPPYEGDYRLVAGQTVPDGLFKDSCDEVVRLHDFRGSYLLIDMSAIDCPPCQQMATQEEQFVAELDAQGIQVEVITLLAPSLSDAVGLTTTGMLTSWINRFRLTSPVLADRAWGLSVFTPAIGEANVGYPSWVLVDPELKVINFGTGFLDFSEHKTAIVADAAP